MTTTAEGRRYAAGKVAAGPGAGYVHLVYLLGAGPNDSWMWATECPADTEGQGWRQVHLAFALVDCPDCQAADRDLVEAVNRQVAGQQHREAEIQQMLGEFLRWAAEEYPLDEGGAMLAVYAGATRLHPLRVDERDQAVTLWLESVRQFPSEQKQETN